MIIASQFRCSISTMPSCWSTTRTSIRHASTTNRSSGCIRSLSLSLFLCLSLSLSVFLFPSLLLSLSLSLAHPPPLALSLDSLPLPSSPHPRQTSPLTPPPSHTPTPGGRRGDTECRQGRRRNASETPRCLWLSVLLCTLITPKRLGVMHLDCTLITFKRGMVEIRRASPSLGARNKIVAQVCARRGKDASVPGTRWNNKPFSKRGG